jgi:hypothetical protein
MPHAASLLQVLQLAMRDARVVRVGVGVLGGVVVCLCVSVCCCLLVAEACGVLVWGSLSLYVIRNCVSKSNEELSNVCYVTSYYVM